MRLKMAQIGARAMQALSPEEAHKATVRLIATGLGPSISNECYQRLRCQVAGIDFPNPVGLAAGFDKNAEAPNQLMRLGFGFVEVGAVTPLPQPGNDKPRVFRLRKDRAVINRYGFNNDGLDVVATRLRKRGPGGIVGINLGANKNSDDRVEDYVKGINALNGLVDFYTVNISSPNTPGLRTLQDANALNDLLARAVKVRNAMPVRTPIFLKVAPDLSDEDKADIASAVLAHQIDALIVSNTTLARPVFLKGPHIGETGGLSGRPLFEPSTAILSSFYRALGDKVPLIGVGGISSADDAYVKIKAGASLIQLYTALIYEGPGLISKITRGLDYLLKKDGFATIREAIGVDVR